MRMPDDLLVGARRQAERAKPPVRAAALLRIARVETAVDRGRAQITFEMGLEEAQALTGREKHALLSQARLVAAAVEPKLLREIPSGRYGHEWTDQDMLVNIMLEHKLVDAAFEYVIDGESSTFPFGYAVNLIQRIEVESQRVAVVRRAVEAWRGSRGKQNHVYVYPFGFIWLFRSQWKLLPAEEALGVVHEIVRKEIEEPEEGISAKYHGEINFTSRREHTLFEIFHVIRHLDPSLAESLIAAHEQLAAAVRRFPDGWETIVAESEQKRRQIEASREHCGGGFAMCGNPRDMPYMRSMIQASRDGDFEPAIEHALMQYEEDTHSENPNEAPKALWPSTSSFRSILYCAGKRLGGDAAAYLKRIPDHDLRLFARIELAAALVGLPELRGVQSRYRPHGRRNLVQG